MRYGFILSPGIFNQVLKEQLKGLQLPPGVVLIQYVDDILLGASDAKTCPQATELLLYRLYEIGFKVSKVKLQFCHQVVSFLGRLVSARGTGVAPAHKDLVLHHPKPLTVKDMLSFLGLTGYSHHFVQEYGVHTSPLRALINEQGMRNLTSPLKWTTEAEESFIRLKQLLCQAAPLATPDYKLPFHLDVSERAHTVKDVLFQKKGG